MTWDLTDVVRATGAEVQRRGSASVFACVATDSRKLAPGALFVALRGEKVDGSQFVERQSERVQNQIRRFVECIAAAVAEAQFG